MKISVVDIFIHSAPSLYQNTDQSLMLSQHSNKGTGI